MLFLYVCVYQLIDSIVRSMGYNASSAVKFAFVISTRPFRMRRKFACVKNNSFLHWPISFLGHVNYEEQKICLYMTIFITGEERSLRSFSQSL